MSSLLFVLAGVMAVIMLVACVKLWNSQQPDRPSALRAVRWYGAGVVACAMMVSSVLAWFWLGPHTRQMLTFAFLAGGVGVMPVFFLMAAWNKSVGDD